VVHGGRQVSREPFGGTRRVAMQPAQCSFNFADQTQCDRIANDGCCGLCFVHCPGDPGSFRGPVAPASSSASDAQSIVSLDAVTSIAERALKLLGWLGSLLASSHVELATRFAQEQLLETARFFEVRHYSDETRLRELVATISRIDGCITEGIRTLSESRAGFKLEDFSLARAREIAARAEHAARYAR
jgi:hypothetical protein